MNRILLIEDDMVLTETIRELLEINGFDNIKSTNSDIEVENILTSFNPDLILMEIEFRYQNDGILIAEKIRQASSIPIIIISSLNDSNTIERVKKIKPEAYILKPFCKETLIITIELVLNNVNSKNRSTYQLQENHTYLYIKDKGWLRKVNVYEIDYIETAENHLRIISSNTEFILRCAIKELLFNLPNGIFVRVHKSFVVNIRNIDAINGKELKIGDHFIPIGKNHYSGLQKYITKINS
ncbi:response regulator [Belliella sp. R4-6]|uniref:Response regulator n=1 Tax=Belliella alkalica TaxID=1730871 RepID=A0ABS9V6S2_9BACT|nr:response regulator [Belliella alkalica]MCH7412116.1 response regulator [Belliella alkalica]